jgi:hypothetical protein
MKLNIPEICDEPMEYIYKGFEGMFIPGNKVPTNRRFQKASSVILLIRAWNYCGAFIKTPQIPPRKATEKEYELIYNAFNSQNK